MRWVNVNCDQTSGAASVTYFFRAQPYSRLRHPGGRRRWLIVLAGAFIVAYAVSVLSYVFSLPDIGLRCAFDTTLNRVYEDYLAPDRDGPKPQENDVIVKLGGEKVLDWRDFVRKQAALSSADFPPVESSRAWSDIHQSQLTHLERAGRRWVRVHFHRASSTDIDSVWCRVGRAPIEAFLPSLLWLLLKFGLFVVGAFVYWKRPDDASAPQFFLLCLVTIGAYVGGYHWLQIVTQPVLILIFMACSVLLPAASLHFYLLFPRPKQFVLDQPRRALALIYGLPGLFLLVLVACYLCVRWLYPENATPESLILFRIIRTVVFVYFAVATLWYLASVISLVQSFRSTQDATERNQVKVDPLRRRGGPGAHRLFPVPGLLEPHGVRRWGDGLADVRGFGLFHCGVYREHHTLSIDATRSADFLGFWLFPAQFSCRRTVL